MKSTAFRCAAEVRRLEDIPNVGPAIARDLRGLGIAEPAALRDADPWALYDRLNARDGLRHDPCVLDVFIAATRFLNGEPAQPWWAYTAERKRRAAEAAAGEGG